MMEQFWDEGGYPTMTKDQHALQGMRLEGLGEEPSEAELGDMRWPQRCWWADRVRIGAPVHARTHTHTHSHACTHARTHCAHTQHACMCVQFFSLSSCGTSSAIWTSPRRRRFL